MTCPKCGSSEWKMASIVYAEGFVSGSTSGYGGGLSTGGIGVGAGQSSGTYQSELSKKAAPPELKETPRETMRTANKVVIWSSLGIVAALFLFGDMSKSEHPIFYSLAGYL